MFRKRSSKGRSDNLSPSDSFPRKVRNNHMDPFALAAISFDAFSSGKQSACNPKEYRSRQSTSKDRPHQRLTGHLPRLNVDTSEVCFVGMLTMLFPPHLSYLLIIFHRHTALGLFGRVFFLGGTKTQVYLCYRSAQLKKESRLEKDDTQLFCSRRMT